MPRTIVPLTSRDNPQVKALRALLRTAKERRAQGLFVVEGIRLVEEALASGRVATLFLCPDLLRAHARGRALLAEVESSRQVRVALLSESLCRELSDTVTPQGVLATCHFAPETALPSRATLAVVLDGVQDPGNTGMILRTAAAAGATGVIVAPGSADPYQPKVVRSAMGAHFHLTVCTPRSLEEATELVQPFPQRVLALAHGGQPYDTVDLTLPAVFIVGSEGHGPRAWGRQLATVAVSIAIASGVESLNVAMATGILLFEAVRQRRAREARP